MFCWGMLRVWETVVPSLWHWPQSLGSSAGIECPVHCAVPIEPANIVASGCAQGAEVARQEYFGIRLQDQRIHAAVRAGIEVGVGTAIRVEARDALVSLPAKRGKITARQNPAVRLHGEATDIAGGHGIEAGIEIAIRTETPETRV